MAKSRVRSTDGGRPFQTSGPQTVNARRPRSVRVHRITAAQVEAERRDRRCGSDAQKATRSATYDGHRCVMTWCMKTASLNRMRYFTGSQWSSRSAEVKCDRRSIHVEQDVQQRSAPAGVEQWSTRGDRQKSKINAMIMALCYSALYKWLDSFLWYLTLKENCLYNLLRIGDLQTNVVVYAQPIRPVRLLMTFNDLQFHSYSIV